MKKRLIVGITGATGAVYGVELLKALNALEDWESHLVLSDAGALNLWHELKMKRKDLEKLAFAAYNPKDIGAAIASGSFLTEGMVIAPCSMKTLAAVAHVTEMGAIVMPPVPAFYALPKSIEDLVAHTVGRVLDLFGLHSARLARWQGMKGSPQERD
jgi:3-polyprenyl-4-hydroxybenzoate decarboxylase